jgi:hypothetical protein
MKKIIAAITLFSFSAVCWAQPATEIYLFDLSAKKDKVVISSPLNITKHKGYDNQPFFHPKKTMIYYSSMNDSARTNILAYNFKTGQTSSVTETHEKEYSPTVTLDEQFLSCIIQRDDGTQDLGKYPIEGGDPTVIINNLKVGYHVWADNSHLGLYVLGTPNQLHYVLLPMKKDTILAQNIGRSLNRIPGQPAISFVVKTSETNWVIKKLNTQTMKIDSLMSTLPGREDLSWLPDGKILMSDGAKLFFAQPSAGKGWTEVTVSAGSEILKGMTRLAVSGDGKKLAVVVSEE